MEYGKELSIAATALAMALFLPVAGANALLSTSEQKCIDGYNNKLRLVGQQAGKDYRKCIKDAGKGRVADPDACVLADEPDKVADKVLKVSELYSGGKCNGTEPIQQGAAPATAAMIVASQGLVHDVFGDPINGVVSPGKAEAKCQDKAYKRAELLFTEMLKTFRSCKKDGMKLGYIADSASLESQCMTPTIPDPKGKIAKKMAKLLDDVIVTCHGVSIATLFPGVCSGSFSPYYLGQCIEQRVGCRACEALNASDGMSRDCDLFDDGIDNSSCGCPGVIVGGSCWVLGALGASCDAACTNNGGLTCASATINYAGSGGSLVQCDEVLDALLGPGTTVDAFAGGPYGCLLQGTTPARYYINTTTCAAAAAGIQRACACE